MKILVIGSGGREHALVWKLKQSASVEKIWCAPGNGGISLDADCVPADLRDVRGLCELARRLKPDLIVVGPELPLVLGLADELRAMGFAVVGPGETGAQFEGSKIFAKNFMERNGIPTARVYGTFESSSDARKALDKVAWPVVIKADGLCAGKGVLVTDDRGEAERFITRAIDDREFGDGGRKILLEEGLTGEELSYIVLTDGQRLLPFVPTRDHKRAFDGDYGPNTGGMGAYSDDSLLPTALESVIQSDVVQPTMQGLRSEGIPYRGFLYFGLMITLNGPKVLEYNCRMGDPETQAILLRADFDLANALMASAQGNLAAIRPAWKRGASVCVVLAAKGYPEKPVIGARITGLHSATGDSSAIAFHAGSRQDDGNYYVSGGRVLGISAFGRNLAAARKSVYDMVSNIKFDGMQFRSDIGGAAVSAFTAINGISP
ncbi:MAG: phosphoribosylamine--glycine ligase [Candidatus Acidiferrales bacterium]|jgi:phosphoribosylamine--glycine ligase